ncbi:hypothetical protein N7455_008945 [Penicillium solitum]|uniref:uncharacterized protein n=1 Tax=Penicillium solitum TaxID=60172 RepID=UPI0032C45FBE|nr:hypothetical protein N7455_008945 [Penicillium solitum]
MSRRIVLITGANSGIGLATAKVLAQASQEFHVILACRSLEKGTQALGELKQEGITGNVSAVQLDVTDETSIKAAATNIQERFGHLDVLMNNAGVASRHPDIKTRLQLCMDTNVIGPAVVSAAFRSLLLKSPNSYSIYVTSGVGSLSLASDPTSKVFRGPSKWGGVSR